MLVQAKGADSLSFVTKLTCQRAVVTKFKRKMRERERDRDRETETDQDRDSRSVVSDTVLNRAWKTFDF